MEGEDGCIEAAVGVRGGQGSWGPGGPVALETSCHAN